MRPQGPFHVDSDRCRNCGKAITRTTDLYGFPMLITPPGPWQHANTLQIHCVDAPVAEPTDDHPAHPEPFGQQSLLRLAANAAG